MADIGCNYGVSETETIAQEARKELSIMLSEVGLQSRADCPPTQLSIVRGSGKLLG